MGLPHGYASMIMTCSKYHAHNIFCGTIEGFLLVMIALTTSSMEEQGMIPICTYSLDMSEDASKMR